MQVTDLTRLYDYHYWATRHVLGVAAQLTAEQFSRSLTGSYGSVRNTLVHILSAEWGWLERCGGPPRGERLNPSHFSTVHELQQTWTRVEGDMRTFLARLTDPDLAQIVEYSLGGVTASRPLGDLLHHAAIHAVHHRGQAALLLRSLGHTPGNFDWLVYTEGPQGVSA